MLRFRRSLVGILVVAVIGAGALFYREFDGAARQEGPLEVLGTRSTEAMDAASPVGPGPREGQLANPRVNWDRRASNLRLDRKVDAQSRRPIHHEEEAFLATDKRLEAKDGTTVGGRALRPETSPFETRIPEVSEDPAQRDAEPVAIDVFLRSVLRTTSRDAEPPDDWTAADTPGRRKDERVWGRGIERDAGRGDYGGQGSDGASGPELSGVFVGSPVMLTCANEPWICNAFSLAFVLPDTIPAVSDGTEAIQFLIAGGPDIVWIRTESGVIEISTENLTHEDQLAALIDQLVPPR
jgi:hypothetical protein